MIGGYDDDEDARQPLLDKFRKWKGTKDEESYDKKHSRKDDKGQNKNNNKIDALTTVHVLPEKEELNKQFVGNRVQTSKYTLWTFFPKNLIEQFSKMANLYFLFIAFMQMVPVISISGGKPAMLVPLTFVIVVSMIKDIFEDYKRHKSDRTENYKETHHYSHQDKDFKKTHWRDLKVGQVVKVQNGNYFPADIVLLASSESKGICYIETKNLDGETSLKHKNSLKDLHKLVKEDQNIEELQGEIVFAEPNDQIYKFEATYRLKNDTTFSISYENFLPRGASLKNTDWVVGIVVHAGHQTKIMQNSGNYKYKISRIERATNKQILIVFVLQLILCAIAAIIGASWMKAYSQKANYMEFDETNPWSTNWFLLFIKTVGTWILIFTNFVPISLLVTMELIKFWQASFMSNEWMMFDGTQDLQASAQASNLNEELGQVQYVFSDKTGTLTCNIMEFKKFSAGPISYGKEQHQRAFEDLKNKDAENHQNIMEVVMHLALCHSVVVDERKDEYNASSPDEFALVKAAKLFGVVFEKRDEENNICIDRFGKKVKYKLLNMLEFTSSRKRMSIIVEDPDGKIVLLCKGADSVIFERINKDDCDFVKKTTEYIEGFAKEGLRTLVLAKREIDKQEYENWNKKFVHAIQKVQNREEEIAKVSEKIEVNMQLVGSTAIEDKLQEGVSETIQFMKDAGIKVWVLTGDKVETATNIGYSSGLLDNEMEKFNILGTDSESVSQEIKDAKKEMHEHNSNQRKTALIVGGDSLLNVYSDDNLTKEMLELCEMTSAVLACRVSPKQKADIVNMVRKKHSYKTTLAIGDGANDVSMILAAHVGVGISGKEGQQAARSSDFVIGQFRFLKPLMFIHGREAYRRNAFTVCYIFYKNVLFVLPQYWYGFYSVFSGQTLYEPWIYQLYNISFTALPIIWYALFDFEHTKEKLLAKPKKYRIGINDECFGMRIFWRWIIYGAWQAIILLWVCFIVFENTVNHDGKDTELWMSGAIVYAGVVVVANIKILDSLNAFVFWDVFVIAFSIASYFAYYWLENIFMEMPILYGTFKPVMMHPVTYLALFFCGMSIFTLDIMMGNIKKFINKRLKVRELVIEKVGEVYNKIGEVAHRPSRHHGFAFSQEEHEPAPMIQRRLTEMILRRASQGSYSSGDKDKQGNEESKLDGIEEVNNK